MRKIILVLLMALCVPLCSLYAQDCSDRIQSAGKIYERYKKTYEKKTLNEARKQLQNLISTPGVPEGCKKEANRLLKTFTPVYKTNVSKANVDVAPIVVHVDTVVEKRVNIDSVVNIVVTHDSLKVKRFYEFEEKAVACYEKKDYECAIDYYQAVMGYGRELQMGEGVLNTIKEKINKNHKLQYNKLLGEAKGFEQDIRVSEAISGYERALLYASDNNLLESVAATALEDKIYYLQAVQQMFDFADQADEYYQAREWLLAKQELDLVIDISDTLGWKRGVIHWKHRLDTLNGILDAVDRVHDYATLEEENQEAYWNLQPELMLALHNSMLRLNYDLPTDTLTMEFLIDTEGHWEEESRMLHEDTLLIRLINEELQNMTVKFPPGIYYGLQVPSKATYEFKIGLEGVEEIAKRKFNGKIIENPLIIGPDEVYRFIRLSEDTVRKVVFTHASPEFLYGKFAFKNVTSSVDNSMHSGFHLVDYKGVGGPANVFLSMLVPGLGRHRVTYGRQLGIGTAVIFYASVGASLGLRYYALDKQMDMKNFFKFKPKSYFHADEEQEQLQPKEVAYWTSYAFAGLAATIYVVDVFYTLIRGSINSAHQHKYKKWSLGVFYEPTSKTPVLQYNYKIK